MFITIPIIVQYLVMFFLVLNKLAEDQNHQHPCYHYHSYMGSWLAAKDFKRTKSLWLIPQAFYKVFKSAIHSFGIFLCHCQRCTIDRINISKHLTLEVKAKGTMLSLHISKVVQCYIRSVSIFRFFIMNKLEVFLSPLLQDGMLVHHRVPQEFNSLVPIYTPGWSETQWYM